MGSEMAVLAVVAYAVVVVASIVAAVFFLLSLQRALRLCAPQNRLMEPGSVWLCLIPLFNVVWIFFTVSRVANSLRREFEFRQASQDDCGRGIGLAYCVLTVTSIIPIVGFLTGLAGFVCWIVFWVRISNLARMLEHGAMPEETPAGDEIYDLGKAWVALLILVFAVAAQHLQVMVLPWYAHKVSEQMHLSPLNLGTAFSAYLFGMMAGYVVMTVVTALCGTRWGLVVAMVGVSLAAAGAGLVSNLGGLVAQRAVLGLFAGGTFPAAIQSIREYFPSALRPLAIGILLATFSILSLLLLPVQPHLTTAIGWQTATMLAGVPSAIAAALCWVLWKRPARGVSQGVSGIAVVSVVMLAVGSLMLTPLYVFAQSWLPMLSMQRFGVQAWIWHFNSAASSVGALAAGCAAWAMVQGGITAWKSRAVLLTLLGLVMPVAILGGTFILAVHPALTSTAIMAAFEGCTVILMVAVADSLPARGVCVGVAVGELISAIMMTVSNPLLGKLTEEYASNVAAGATAIAAACGVICIALLAWLVRPQPAQRSESPATAA